MLKIGKLKVENRLILAPMAGITNLPFRLMCREEGAGLVFSEMVSATALTRNSRKTFELFRTDPAEGTLVVQLFGSEPQILAEAARIVQDHGAEVVDVNMGCPAKKIVSNGAGSALLKDPLVIRDIVEGVRKSVSIPFTVKIRSGWDSRSLNYLEVGRIAEEYGADAVTLHSRTAAQQFGGHSDWSHIAELKKTLHIPVIGNGDVKAPEDAGRMLEETGCDAVMIGRGAMGNPWIFSRTLRYLEEGIVPPQPAAEEILKAIRRHLLELADLMGKKGAVKDFRKHIAWYTRGLPYSAEFRKTVINMESLEDLLDEAEAFFESFKPGMDEYFMNAFGAQDYEIGAQ